MEFELKEKLDEKGEPIHGLLDLGALSGLVIYWVYASVRSNHTESRIEAHKIDKEKLTIDTRNITDGRAYTMRVICGTSRGTRRVRGIAFPATVKDNSHIFEKFEEMANYHRGKSVKHMNLKIVANNENRPEAKEEHNQASAAHEKAAEAYEYAIRERDDLAGDALNTKTELAKRESQEAYDADDIPPIVEKEIPFVIPKAELAAHKVGYGEEKLLRLVQLNKHKFHRDEAWDAFRKILPSTFFMARPGEDKIKPRAWDMYYYTTRWPILNSALALKQIQWERAGKVQTPDTWDCNRIAHALYSYFPEVFGITPLGAFMDDHKKYGSAHAYNPVFGVDDDGKLSVKIYDGTEKRFIKENELHKTKWKMSGGYFYH